MKRIVVLMALLSIFLWCSNSSLAYSPIAGNYTVTPTVTGPVGGYYTYDYGVYNVNQINGLDGFIIQVPLTANVQNIVVPAGYSGGYWTNWVDAVALGFPFAGEIPNSGYKFVGWWGQEPPSVYPPGTTPNPHFRFDVNAPPGSNLAYAVTYNGGYAIFQDNVTSPVPVPPTVLLLGSGLAGLGLLRFRRKT